MAQVCRALNLSDEKPCQGEATHADGLFCGFHSRQCMGMYLGYKKRNAQLDALNATLPDYLSESRTPLRNETFDAVQDEKTLNELYHYLFKKHNLLDRVIRARRLHHAHFYSQALDYGHKQYLDRLVNDRSSVVQALEKLQRRTAEVLYEQQKWFSWVRRRQDEEEETRETESKKVKKEALLFKRHIKTVNARLEKKRRLEEKKKQDTYLDKAYEERLKEAKEGDSDINFDPIEDTIEDERTDYVDLMRRLMWLAATPEQSNVDEPDPNGDASKMSSVPDRSRKSKATEKENVDPMALAPVKSTITGNRNAKKRAKAKAKAEARAEEESAPKVEVNETREQMRDRLLHGQQFDLDQGMDGFSVAGTMDKPMESLGKIPGMPADDVERILDDIAEIKQLLLCRLLLSQAALLPAALRANSVDEFLADPEITTGDLRDLCLRIEQPALQEIRDACADFARGDVEDSDDEQDAEDEQDEFEKSISSKKTSGITGMLHRTRLPDKWSSKREALNELRKQPGQTGSKDDDVQFAIDFGDLDEEGNFRNKKIRVRICGKTIWNYPSEKVMARGGWLHYSIIAKGTRFEDAINLCRNWQEFWELNVLALFQYFPSPEFSQWERNQMMRQLLQLGLIPYCEFTRADKYTKARQQRGRGRGPTQHAAVEMRNFVCAYMKRNDPVSRRFVQYVSMMANHVCIIVRDGKTGRLLIKPPNEHLWLVRRKAGIGRASKNEWDVVAEVGKDMFEQLSEYKKYGSYSFGFNEYYDITIWDLEAGSPFTHIYDTIHTALAKAHRVCTGRDLYNPVGAVLKTLHRDKVSGRARDVKPGESSMYDDLHSKNYRVLSGDALKGSHSFTETFPEDFFYDERDAAEDLVLFPEERHGEMTTAIKGFDDPITLAIETEPDLKRFIHDLDTDDDADDFEDVEGPNMGKKPPQKLLSDSEPAEGGDSEWESESEDELPLPPDGMLRCPDPRNPKCRCEECIWYEEHPEAGSPAQSLEMMVLMEVAAEGDPGHEDDLRNQFYRFREREAAKTTRQQWHEADLTDSKERWRAMADLLKEARGLQQPFSVPTIIELLKLELWLQYPKSEHRLVWRDMHDALTLASLSFEWCLQYQVICAKLSPEKLQLLRDLTDNAKKAQGQPYSRSINSVDTRPKDFWTETWRPIEDNDRKMLPAWDLFARPITAVWFRAGIIGPSYQSGGSGEMCVAKEQGKEHLEVFIDYRNAPTAEPPVNTDFRSIDLVANATIFAAKHAGARFALLRLWSHSHFWPLQMAGFHRDVMAFIDTKGRCWQSRFVPKDMPLSDFSMQWTVGERTSRFKKQLAGRVVFKRDMALVLGETEADLRWNTAAVIFALTSRPWRFEVDMWTSFVNVDLGFLQGLDKKWLD